MVAESAKVNIQPVLTKEQIAYDEALKNLRLVTARLKISQEGVDMENVSDEKLTIASKLFDEMDTIQRDFNIEAQKIQQDINSRMKTLQEDANKKFGEVQNRYRELIDSMKSIDTVGQEECSAHTCGINMSKEKEEELKKMLAEELARAQREKTEQ